MKRLLTVLLAAMLALPATAASAQTAYETARDGLSSALDASCVTQTQYEGVMLAVYDLENGDVTLHGFTSDGIFESTSWTQNGFDGFDPYRNLLASYDSLQASVDASGALVFILVSGDTAQQAALSATQAQDMMRSMTAQRTIYAQRLDGLWTCMYCSTANQGDVCTQCMSPKSDSLVSQWICPGCGEAFSGAKPRFCSSCGTNLQTGATTAPAVSPTTAPAAAQYGAPQVGVLNTRMATRTGPGTQFEEPGTFLAAGDEITVYSIAYDVNGVPWVQTDVTTKDGKMRAYTGLKRVNGLDVSQLRREGNINLPCQVIWDTVPRYGPGYDYAPYEFTFRSGRSFTIRDIEGDWALVEFYAAYDDLWYHLWIATEHLSY